MPLDIAIPARFLETAYADDDLIAIAYRSLAGGGRPRMPRPRPGTVPHGASGADLGQPAPANGDAPTSPRWHHRFVTAAAARAPRFLAWLRYLNAQGNDVFVSMNTFTSNARRRTEVNVHTIRHIYADFDSGGDDALRALRARQDLPPVSYVTHSSRGKFQVIWNVRDFEPAYAKRLLCLLAYSLGADLAVHDLNRVLRLPGFFNHKYSPPQFVRVETGRDLRPTPPDAFPIPPDKMQHVRTGGKASVSRHTLPGTTKAVSRSERDWATVRSALAGGRSWQKVWSDLVAARQDKPNPLFYASLTVLKALNSLDRQDPPELVAALNGSKAGRSTTLSPASSPRS